MNGMDDFRMSRGGYTKPKEEMEILEDWLEMDTGNEVHGVLETKIKCLQKNVISLNSKNII
jgi:hypothetical protein